MEFLLRSNIRAKARTRRLQPTLSQDAIYCVFVVVKVSKDVNAQDHSIHATMLRHVSR